MEKSEIRALGKKIPFGKQKDLIKSTGFSAPYISRFFNGDYQLTAENSILIKEAKRIIQAEQDAIEKNIGE